jgi:hypothetical protein
MATLFDTRHNTTYATPSQRDRAVIASELHQMMDYRLFESDRWLSKWDECTAISRRLIELGLNEVVPGRSDSFRATALGREFRIDLSRFFSVPGGITTWWKCCKSMGISITRPCVNYGDGSTAEEILKASFAGKFRRFICSIAVLLIIPTNMLMAQNDISWLLLKATFAYPGHIP